MISKSAADAGETALLACEAEGVPNVTFSWGRVGGAVIKTKNEDFLRPEKAMKYSERTLRIGLLQSRSELVIRGVSSLDYGAYECVARNTEGSSRTTVQLDAKSRPDPPDQLRVVNVTHASVLLSWRPGFHGGMDQYFR